VAVLLSACTTSSTTPTPTGSTSGSGGGNPSAIATASTPTASETPTALPYPTDVPAAARTHDAAGAEAFVKYYFELFNLAWTRPQAGLLAPLCQPTSKSCRANEAGAQNLVTNRERYDGPPLTELAIAGSIDADGTSLVRFNGRQEARKVIRADSGLVIASVPMQPAVFDISLVWTPMGWSISTIKTVTT